MKQVVSQTSPETAIVEVDQTSGRKYYGVLIPDDQRGIVRHDRNQYDFEVLCPNGFTSGNSWGGYGGRGTLKEFLAFLILQNLKVFEFDTFLDLAQWVSEGNK